MQVEGSMKWGKRLGRIGFVVGFVGPVLFYSFDMQSVGIFVCPQCPHIDFMFYTRMDWVGLDLRSREIAKQPTL